MITAFVLCLTKDEKIVLWKADMPTEIVMRGRGSRTYVGDEKIDQNTGFKLISQIANTFRLNEGDVLYGLCTDDDSELFLFVSAYKTTEKT